MQRSYITQQAENLIRQCATRDPFEIAKVLGLRIQFADIGTLEGFYTILEGQHFVVINNQLDARQAAGVLAHEIGHDRLHRCFAGKDSMQNTMFYDMAQQPEREADLFAAALLLDKNVVEPMAESGQTASQIAAALGVPTKYVKLYFENR